MDSIADQVRKYLKDENAEYIDCYNAVIDSQLFFNLGFVEKKGSTIVPNYFEPFELRNGDMHYASDLKRNVVIFKADADQDRPNII